ncbi:MAG: hypothetical protein ACOH2B_05680 [Burkholderiaceae bacterium]
MKPRKIFIDAEYTNLMIPEMISIGRVADRVPGTGELAPKCREAGAKPPKGGVAFYGFSNMCKNRTSKALNLHCEKSCNIP